jgi:hypothetical protein
MKRLPLVIALLFLLFISSVGSALALTIDTIGTTTVPNGRVSSWYYQGSNPNLSGTAVPSTDVTVSINGTSNTATTDSSGTWSFKPTTLSQTGTYPIILTSGTDTLSFSLDITATSSTASALSSTKGGTMSGSVDLPDTLPQSGSLQETIGLISAGMVLMVGGMLFYWKVVPRLLFTDDQDESQQ